MKPNMELPDIESNFVVTGVYVRRDVANIAIYLVICVDLDSFSSCAVSHYFLRDMIGNLIASPTTIVSLNNIKDVESFLKIGSMIELTCDNQEFDKWSEITINWLKNRKVF